MQMRLDHKVGYGFLELRASETYPWMGNSAYVNEGLPRRESTLRNKVAIHAVMQLNALHAPPLWHKLHKNPIFLYTL